MEKLNTVTPDTVSGYEALKRKFESAYTSGSDCGAECMALAKAVAFSVVNKTVDPQRKTAGKRNKVSDNGLNPVMIALRRGIAADTALLDNTRYNAGKATRVVYDTKGNCVTETEDKTAFEALNDIITDTLSDGVDLVQEAAVALLEMAYKYADMGTEWLDATITVQRAKRRIVTSFDEKPELVDKESTPIQEVYKAVRRHIESMRSVKVDITNTYTYVEIDGMEADGVDGVYWRSGRYADITGYSGKADRHGLPGTPDGYKEDTSFGAGSAEMAGEIDTMLDSLDLTPPQENIVRMRLEGKSVVQVAEYLGINREDVYSALHKAQDKAIKHGLIPRNWNSDTRCNAKREARAVVQMDESGNVVKEYKSINAASKETGIDKANISAACRYDGVKHLRRYAGNYVWMFKKEQGDAKK